MSAPWARAFRAASRLRGERAIHARGATFAGTVSFPGGLGLGLALLDEPSERPAVVRLSRAVGLPSPFPDFLGLAVRVVDAGGPDLPQDLLLDTGASPPLLRHLPLPRRRLSGVLYSSLVTFDVGGRRLLLGARPVAWPPLSSMEEVAPALPLDLELLVAPRSARWRPVGRVTLHGVLPAPAGRRVRFSPGTCGGGVLPVGRLNRWRLGAYEASHVGSDE